MRTCLACGQTVDQPTCPSCGRAFVYRSWLAAQEDDVEYDFSDATPEERAEAADLVAGAAIAYRWDPGSVLRVAASTEDQVDGLFGHDSEERTALAALRGAAAALATDATDEAAMVELADAAGVVSTADPPDGLNRVLWSTVGYLARQLLDLADDDDIPDEDVTAAAAALKAVLA